VFEGESIVGLFLFRSLHQVLENNAKIESFSIGYRFPFSLAIRVTEKKPWLSCLVEGDSVLLDESGVVLSYGGDNSMIEGDSLFVVKGLDKGDFLADRIEPLVWRRLRELQGYFSDFLPGTGLMLEQGADGAFQLVIDDHMVVYLGVLRLQKVPQTLKLTIQLLQVPQIHHHMIINNQLKRPISPLL
jgi:cell division septal protein FtsQ